jgi:hypothetical protein
MIRAIKIKGIENIFISRNEFDLLKKIVKNFTKIKKKKS